jgi:hypothetical protein
MRVYCASKAGPLHVEMWKALRACGLPIVAPWIDAPLNQPGAATPSNETWRDHWHACIEAACSADVLLFYSAEGETACGQLIEAGAALGAGKQVWIVSHYDWTIAHHPRCRVFPSLADAVAAIVAATAGERARLTTPQGYPKAAA